MTPFSQPPLTKPLPPPRQHTTPGCAFHTVICKNNLPTHETQLHRQMEGKWCPGVIPQGGPACSFPNQPLLRPQGPFCRQTLSSLRQDVSSTESSTQ